MHKGNGATNLKPRYLRATFFTGLAAAAVPAIISAIGIYSISEDPAASASEAQGFVIFIAHFIVSVLFVVAAYPGVAWLLHRRGTLTKQLFYKWLFVPAYGFAFIPALTLAGVGFGATALFLVPVSFVLICLLSLPFRPLWLRLAS